MTIFDNEHKCEMPTHDTDICDNKEHYKCYRCQGCKVEYHIMRINK